MPAGVSSLAFLQGLKMLHDTYGVSCVVLTPDQHNRIRSTAAYATISTDNTHPHTSLFGFRLRIEG